MGHVKIKDAGNMAKMPFWPSSLIFVTVFKLRFQHNEKSLSCPHSFSGVAIVCSDIELNWKEMLIFGLFTRLCFVFCVLSHFLIFSTPYNPPKGQNIILIILLFSTLITLD